MIKVRNESISQELASLATFLNYRRCLCLGLGSARELKGAKIEKANRFFQTLEATKIQFETLTDRDISIPLLGTIILNLIGRLFWADC